MGAGLSCSAPLMTAPRTKPGRMIAPNGAKEITAPRRKPGEHQPRRPSLFSPTGAEQLLSPIQTIRLPRLAEESRVRTVRTANGGERDSQRTVPRLDAEVAVESRSLAESAPCRRSSACKTHRHRRIAQLPDCPARPFFISTNLRRGALPPNHVDVPFNPVHPALRG